jgi:hypothetical protein
LTLNGRVGRWQAEQDYIQINNEQVAAAVKNAQTSIQTANDTAAAVKENAEVRAALEALQAKEAALKIAEEQTTAATTRSASDTAKVAFEAAKAEFDAAAAALTERVDAAKLLAATQAEADPNANENSGN